MRLLLEIEGMTSVHAVHAILTALTPVPGLTRVDVRLGTAELDHDGRATPELVREAIAVAGFRVASWTVERGGLPILGDGDATD